MPSKGRTRLPRSQTRKRAVGPIMKGTGAARGPAGEVVHTAERDERVRDAGVVHVRRHNQVVAAHEVLRSRARHATATIRARIRCGFGDSVRKLVLVRRCACARAALQRRTARLHAGPRRTSRNARRARGRCARRRPTFTRAHRAQSTGHPNGRTGWGAGPSCSRAGPGAAGCLGGHACRSIAPSVLHWIRAISRTSACASGIGGGRAWLSGIGARACTG
jgi:hypothetical protein